MAAHVVLMGPMGCGKSTIGSAVAAMLDRPLLDNDAVLAEAVGLSARQVHETWGLDRLHATEVLVLRRMLAEPEPAVITAAASTLANAPTRELRPHLVALLQCAPGLAALRAAERVERDEHRAPTVRIDDDSWERRLRRIGAIADIVIDTATSSVDEAASTIAALVPNAPP